MSYALITGAAKGIGKAIARELARKGYNLMLVDKDRKQLLKTEEEIESEFKVTVHVLPLDLTARYAMESLQNWTGSHNSQLTIVVNNAGYGLGGAFEEMLLEDQLNIIDLNIKVQVSICHAYLPVLRKQPKAYLLNVSSTTAFQTVPYLNIYAATKVFVLSFTRGLRYELRKTPVSVSCLIPGSTDTYVEYWTKMGSSVKKKAVICNMSHAEVGKIAVRGLFKGQAEIIPGFKNKLRGFLPRFFPKGLAERIAGNIYGKDEKKKSLSFQITT
jgi:hypothetical protein